MTEGKWEVVTTVSGSLQADIIRTLLESRDIEVFLNQEGAGRVYGINVGPLGEVQILVPESQSQEAQQTCSGKKSDCNKRQFKNLRP